MSTPCSPASHSWVLPALPESTLENAPVLPVPEKKFDPHFQQTGFELAGYLPDPSHPPEHQPALFSGC